MYPAQAVIISAPRYSMYKHIPFKCMQDALRVCRRACGLQGPPARFPLVRRQPIALPSSHRSWWPWDGVELALLRLLLFLFCVLFCLVVVVVLPRSYFFCFHFLFFWTFVPIMYPCIRLSSSGVKASETRQPKQAVSK